MKLQEIFDQLSTGEFSQLSIGGQDTGVIAEANYGKVVPHVNLALTALFTRFKLKEGSLQIALQDGQTLYKLNSIYAVNGRGIAGSVRYIIDTADDKFLDDVTKVEKVLTDTGLELGLNDAADLYTVTTPSALQLRVPAGLVSTVADFPVELATEQLTVIYRAAHPKLVVPLGYFDPTRIEVQLPDSHLEALLYHVASRVHMPVGMANEGNLSSGYFAKYEEACQKLLDQGLQVDQGGTNTRLERNGWA